jgi:beta-lactamase superfamily II metal-dependent hydrolase
MSWRGIRTLLVGLGTAALLAWSPAANAAAQPPLQVDFIDVGQGDAALITSPTGKRVLIDGGPQESAAALVGFLRTRNVEAIDLIVLTHRHADHLGGLRAVVLTFPTQLFLDAPFPHPSEAYQELLEQLAAKRVTVRNAELGRKVDIGGGATLTLLGPPEPPFHGTRSDPNTNSVVVRLDYRAASVLFAADAEAKTEAWLLRQHLPLQARVLKVAHHGSRYSSSRRFLRAVHPEVAVVSVGARNEFGHPAPETLARLEQLGARTYRTDRDGTVTVTTDGGRLTVRAARADQAILAAP